MIGLLHMVVDAGELGLLVVLYLPVLVDDGDPRHSELWIIPDQFLQYRLILDISLEWVREVAQRVDHLLVITSVVDFRSLALDLTPEIFDIVDEALIRRDIS